MQTTAEKPFGQGFCLCGHCAQYQQDRTVVARWAAEQLPPAQGWRLEPPRHRCRRTPLPLTLVHRAVKSPASTRLKVQQRQQHQQYSRLESGLRFGLRIRSQQFASNLREVVLALILSGLSTKINLAKPKNIMNASPWQGWFYSKASHLNCIWYKKCSVCWTKKTSTHWIKTQILRKHLKNHGLPSHRCLFWGAPFLGHLSISEVSLPNLLSWFSGVVLAHGSKILVLYLMSTNCSRDVDRFYLGWSHESPEKQVNTWLFSKKQVRTDQIKGSPVPTGTKRHPAAPTWEYSNSLIAVTLTKPIGLAGAHDGSAFAARK